MRILFAGQSNAEFLDGTPQIAQFGQELGAQVDFAAWGGSALVRRNASRSTPNNYWLEDDYSNGVRMRDTISAMEPNDPYDYVIWVQGEQDATRIRTAGQADAYLSGLTVLSQKFLAHNPNMQFLVCRIGQRLSADKDLGISLVQGAQTEAISRSNYIHLGADYYDLDLLDSVHLSAKGRAELLWRLSRNIRRLESGKCVMSEPYVVQATARRANQSRILVELGNVTKLYMGTSSLPLFKILGSYDLQIQRRIKISSQTLQLNLSGPVRGHQLAVAYGDYPDIDTSGGKQIRNEHLVPIRPQVIDIRVANWG